VLNLVAWYLVVSLVGWLPSAAYRLLPALSDRGYTASRALGLLVWGYAFWLLASLGCCATIREDCCLLWRFWRPQHLGSAPGWPGEMLSWMREHARLLFTVEVLFLVAFAGWAAVRATNPEAVGTRSRWNWRSSTPSWLAYFSPQTLAVRVCHLILLFGYVIVAMLAKITGTAGSVAFNLGIALIFALSAAGAYGWSTTVERSGNWQLRLAIKDKTDKKRDAQDASQPARAASRPISWPRCSAHCTC